jgi:hypothetical protein
LYYEKALVQAEAIAELIDDKLATKQNIIDRYLESS